MKTIIIDDRKERKKQHLTTDEIEKLKTLSDISETILPFQELEGYSLIAIHESLLTENNLYNEIVSFAKNNEKLLILFSGGIMQNCILESGKILKIISSEFYNKITAFLLKYSKENIEYPLLKFLYGEEWKLPLLLKYKNLLWKYGAIDSSKMVLNREDRSIEDEIREILIPDSDSITLEWIENEIDKTRRN